MALPRGRPRRDVSKCSSEQLSRSLRADGTIASVAAPCSPAAGGQSQQHRASDRVIQFNDLQSERFIRLEGIQSVETGDADVRAGTAAPERRSGLESDEQRFASGWARTDLFANGPGFGLISCASQFAAPLSVSPLKVDTANVVRATLRKPKVGGLWSNGLYELRGPPAPARIMPTSQGQGCRS